MAPHSGIDPNGHFIGEGTTDKQDREIWAETVQELTND